MRDEYNANFSPNCLRVRAVVHELDVELEIVEVDVFGGENKTPQRVLKPRSGHGGGQPYAYRRPESGQRFPIAGDVWRVTSPRRRAAWRALNGLRDWHGGCITWRMRTPEPRL